MFEANYLTVEVKVEHLTTHPISNAVLHFPGLALDAKIICPDTTDLSTLLDGGYREVTIYSNRRGMTPYSIRIGEERFKLEMLP